MSRAQPNQESPTGTASQFQEFVDQISKSKRVSHFIGGMLAARLTNAEAQPGYNGITPFTYLFTASQVIGDCVRGTNSVTGEEIPADDRLSPQLAENVAPLVWQWGGDAFGQPFAESVHFLVDAMDDDNTN